MPAQPGAWTWELTVIAERRSGGNSAFAVTGRVTEKLEVLAPEGLTALRMALDSLGVEPHEVTQLSLVRLRQLLIAPPTVKRIGRTPSR